MSGHTSLSSWSLLTLAVSAVGVLVSCGGLYTSDLDSDGDHDGDHDGDGDAAGDGLLDGGSGGFGAADASGSGGGGGGPVHTGVPLHCVPGQYVSSPLDGGYPACVDCSAGSYSTTNDAESCTAWSSCKEQWSWPVGTSSADTLCTSGQFGSYDYDSLHAVGVDATGNVYVAGLFGHQAILQKRDPTGVLLWSQQFPEYTLSLLALTVTPSGELYVAGATTVPLEGSMTGQEDAFLRKYDLEGNLLWTRQFGAAFVATVTSVAVAADGHVYVAGALEAGSYEEDSHAFVRKYDAAANLLWEHVFDAGRKATGLALDPSGNVYVAGPGNFLHKLNSSGSEQWSKPPNSQTVDESVRLAIGPGGGIYLAFPIIYQNGNVQLRKFDASGKFVWTKTFGSVAVEVLGALVVNAADDVYVVGSTAGSLHGSNQGWNDAFVRKYSGAGELLSTRQFGTAGNDEAYAATIGPSAGNLALFVAGASTRPGQSGDEGDEQAFVTPFAL